MFIASQKKMIIVIFCLSLICGCLVCTSLTTNYWIESNPWRQRNPSESSGYLHFGLLYGRKELNVAFGIRIYNITVTDMINKEPYLMSGNLWCVTLITTFLAFLCTGFILIVAFENIIRAPRIIPSPATSLCICNTIAFLMCLSSICSWTIQFHIKLYKNVLPKEDLDNFWTSNGMSKLGYSFWLIVIACLIYLLNIAIIKCSIVHNKRKTKNTLSTLEEKSHGAIMLY